jgi:hypothetical protein
LIPGLQFIHGESNDRWLAGEGTKVVHSETRMHTAKNDICHPPLLGVHKTPALSGWHYWGITPGGDSRQNQYSIFWTTITFGKLIYCRMAE